MSNVNEKNLEVPISSILFHKAIKENNSSIEKCTRCDIRKYFLVVPSEFTSHGTKRMSLIRDTLICNTKNIIYLKVGKSCRKQYIGSAKVILISVRLSVE